MALQDGTAREELSLQTPREPRRRRPPRKIGRAKLMDFAHAGEGGGRFSVTFFWVCSFQSRACAPPVSCPCCCVSLLASLGACLAASLLQRWSAPDADGKSHGARTLMSAATGQAFSAFWALRGLVFLCGFPITLVAKTKCSRKTHAHRDREQQQQRVAKNVGFCSLCLGLLGHGCHNISVS